MYGVLMVPTSTVLDQDNAWDINIYDDDGDFVMKAGTATREQDGITYTDISGWSQTFADAKAASRAVMQAGVSIDKNKLN